MTIPFIAVRIVGRAPGALYRTAYLTPYLAETIAEDVLRSGPGTRVEVVVKPRSNAHGPDWVHDQLAWLGARGAEVRVRGVRTRRPAPRPAA